MTDSTPAESARQSGYACLMDTTPRTSAQQVSDAEHVRPAVHVQTVDAVRTLQMLAEKAATAPLDTVTSKRITPPSGDKRDFVSLKQYAWPSNNSTQHPTGQWALRSGFPFTGVCLDVAYKHSVFLPVPISLRCVPDEFVPPALLVHGRAEPIAARSGCQLVDAGACLLDTKPRNWTQHGTDAAHAACHWLCRRRPRRPRKRAGVREPSIVG